MVSTVAIPVESLTVSQSRTIALVGNPNSGKSTVFNRLTGLRQKTANYPGVPWRSVSRASSSIARSSISSICPERTH